MVVTKNSIFPSSKFLFKAVHLIQQVLNVQILSQQMDEPRWSMLCYFRPSMTLTKGYVFFISHLMNILQ
jgi:hypothetical protein